MGRGKGKGINSNVVASTSVLGFLANHSTLRSVESQSISDITLSDITSTVGHDLQGHVNSVFRLRETPDIGNACVCVPGEP